MRRWSREQPDWVKDTIKYEVAEAERLTGADIGRALAQAGADVRAEPRSSSRRYDYFVLPVTQVAPFDVTHAVSDARSPARRWQTYIDWMRSCWYVTFMSQPGDLGAGRLHASGLPVGIQIVGRHRDDWSVLQLAHAFEQATGHGKRRPPVTA